MQTVQLIDLNTITPSKEALLALTVQKPIIMFVTQVCPYCTMATQLLAKKGIANEYIYKVMLDKNPEHKMAMMELTGRRTVPQIYILGQHIGGFDDLNALDQEKNLEQLSKLDVLLKQIV